MRFRTVVRQTHLWVGLIFSVVLFALAVSGSALVYKEASWRLVHPELREPAVPPSPRAAAEAVAAAVAHFGDQVRSVKMPEPGVGAYHLYLQEGEAFLTLDDYRVVDRWQLRERAMGFLFDLHAHLLAGERGEKVGGAIALMGVFLLISGVILWWPARRRTGLSTLIPRTLSRPRLIAMHRDWGVLSSPVLLILLLTGAGIVFYGAAGAILNGIFGDRNLPSEPLTPPVTVPARGLPTPATMAAAQGAFPDARLVFYYPPADGSPVHRFRLKRPCELHPNGRSYVDVDGTDKVVHNTDACALRPGERALHAVYPLHSGKMPSDTYKLATFLGGLVLAVLSATGALAYLKRLLRLEGPNRLGRQPP